VIQSENIRVCRITGLSYPLDEYVATTFGGEHSISLRKEFKRKLREEKKRDAGFSALRGSIRQVVHTLLCSNERKEVEKQHNKSRPKRLKYSFQKKNAQLTFLPVLMAIAMQDMLSNETTEVKDPIAVVSKYTDIVVDWWYTLAEFRKGYKNYKPKAHAIAVLYELAAGIQAVDKYILEPDEFLGSILPSASHLTGLKFDRRSVTKHRIWFKASFLSYMSSDYAK